MIEDEEEREGRRRIFYYTRIKITRFESNEGELLRDGVERISMGFFVLVADRYHLELNQWILHSRH